MSNLRTSDDEIENTLLQRLQEDKDSSFIDQLVSKLELCMEEIEVARLNSEDAQAIRQLDGLHHAAFVCTGSLREVWSNLHLRRRA